MHSKTCCYDISITNIFFVEQIVCYRLRSGGFDGWHMPANGGGGTKATAVFHLKLAEREWVMMPYILNVIIRCTRNGNSGFLR